VIGWVSNFSLISGVAVVIGGGAGVVEGAIVIDVEVLDVDVDGASETAGVDTEVDGDVEAGDAASSELEHAASSETAINGARRRPEGCFI
jgi:hypothetical protein